MRFNRRGPLTICRSSLISIILILPFLDISSFRKAFTVHLGYYYIPAISIAYIILIPIVLLVNIDRDKTYTIHKLESKLSLNFVLFLVVQLAYTIFITQQQYTFWNALALFLPARLLSSIIFFNYSDYDNDEVVNHYLGFFSIYLIFTILFWFYKYREQELARTGGLILPRLISTGGGPVILGYTIAVLLPLVMEKYESKPKAQLIALIVLLYFALLLTGTRGGIWLSLIMMILFLIRRRTGPFLVLVFTILSCIAIWQLPSMISVAQRVVNPSNNARITTWRNCINLLSKMGPLGILLGSGLGNFFPYSAWLSNESSQVANSFYMKEALLLVQPHNLYIYVFIESGVLGLITFLAPIWVLCSSIIKNIKHLRKKVWYIIGSVCLLILLGLDSILIIVPGTSLLWWYLIYYYYMKLNLDNPAKKQLQHQIGDNKYA